MMTRTFSHTDLIRLDDLLVHARVLKQLADTPDSSHRNRALPAAAATAAKKMLTVYDALHDRIQAIIQDERGSVW